jgi:peroxiredoxin
VLRFAIAAAVLAAPAFVAWAGERAPGLEWTDLRGGPAALDDYRGRIVVLNFWATWCPPCAAELPDLAWIQREFAIFGVQVVGAAADPPAERERVLQFARRRKVNFPVALGATPEQMRALGLGEGLPATVVLDAEGRIVERTDGPIERRELATAIERLLGATPSPTAAAPGQRHEAPATSHGPRGEAPAGDHAREPAHDHGHDHGHATTEASLVPS